MNELIGLSFNSTSLPLLSFDQAAFNLFLGVACYPTDEYSAILLKNLKLDKHSNAVHDLSAKMDLSSTVFLLQIPESSHRLKTKDAQPFLISYAGRDWTFIASGGLSEQFKQFANLQSPAFQPKGTSAFEWLFCWLMQAISQANATGLESLNLTEFHLLLKSANQYGSLNILLSDGRDLLVYHDMNQSEPINWFRSCPPRQEDFKLAFKDTELSLDPLNINHTFIIVTNQVINNVQHASLLPQQLLVIRRSEVIWNSHLVAPQSDVTQSSQPATATDEKPYRPSSTLKQIHLIEVDKSLYLSSATLDKNPAIYSISHESQYHYDSPVELSRHLFRMQPLHDLTQTLLHYDLKVLINGKPLNNLARNFIGAFGNHATLCEIDQPYTELSIISNALVSIFDSDTLRMDLLRQHQTIPLIWMPWDRVMMQAYLVPPELPESELFELSEYAMSFVHRHNNDVLAVLDDINETIYRDFAYISGSTSLYTTPYEVFVKHRGVCQDFANLFICLARLLNIPARYRAGYIYTGGNYENKIQSDATHAWLEVFLPTIGWKGYDPTNCSIVNKDHIRVACGRNYRDATPTSGTIYAGGAGEKLLTAVKIVQLNADELKSMIKK